jgi:hypothetical protein
MLKPGEVTMSHELPDDCIPAVYVKRVERTPQVIGDIKGPGSYPVSLGAFRAVERTDGHFALYVLAKAPIARPFPPDEPHAMISRNGGHYEAHMVMLPEHTIVVVDELDTVNMFSCRYTRG